MIVKDEEKRLAFCLNPIHNLLDEIIIVDTGSTDKTIQIAKRYTDKIYQFKWCDDFSAARNFSLSKATKDWILILDADEYIHVNTLLHLISYIYDLQKKPPYPIILSNIKSFHCDYSNRKILCRARFSDGYVPRVFYRKYNYRFTGFVNEYLNGYDTSRTVIFNEPIYHFKDFLKNKGYYLKLCFKGLKTPKNKIPTRLFWIYVDYILRCSSKSDSNLLSFFMKIPLTKNDIQFFKIHAADLCKQKPLLFKLICDYLERGGINLDAKL